MRPISEPALTLAGRPTHGLFREPWTSANCGLMSPWVLELPNSWWAPLPDSEVVPPSLPMASAGVATAAEAPTMETAAAAVAITFLITGVPF